MDKYVIKENVIVCKYKTYSLAYNDGIFTKISFEEADYIYSFLNPRSLEENEDISVSFVRHYIELFETQKNKKMDKRVLSYDTKYQECLIAYFIGEPIYESTNRFLNRAIISPKNIVIENSTLENSLLSIKNSGNILLKIHYMGKVDLTTINKIITFCEQNGLFCDLYIEDLSFDLNQLKIFKNIKAFNSLNIVYMEIHSGYKELIQKIKDSSDFITGITYGSIENNDYEWYFYTQLKHKPIIFLLEAITDFSETIVKEKCETYFKILKAHIESKNENPLVTSLYVYQNGIFSFSQTPFQITLYFKENYAEKIKLLTN